MQQDYSEDAVAELVRARLDVIGSRDTARRAAPGGVGVRRRVSDLVATSARRIVRACRPPDDVVAVVSRGDADLLQLDGRPAWHFPEARPGVYAGYHPADSAAAIAALEAARARGADVPAVPGTAFWWLDHYEEFRTHLDARYRCVWRTPLRDLRPARREPRWCRHEADSSS